MGEDWSLLVTEVDRKSGAEALGLLRLALVPTVTHSARWMTMGSVVQPALAPMTLVENVQHLHVVYIRTLFMCIQL